MKDKKEVRGLDVLKALVEIGIAPEDVWAASKRLLIFEKDPMSLGQEERQELEKTWDILGEMLAEQTARDAADSKC